MGAAVVRVFQPLRGDHPLVADGDTCALCKQRFAAGNRTVLAPAREPQQGVETMPAVPLHATCALRGARTPVGVVERIKDGDASPHPVILEGGREVTLAEAGFDG